MRKVGDCSSEIGSSSAQPDENCDESTEEGSCSPEEFSENEETSKTFVHTVSREIAFNLPREPSAYGLQNEDRVILHRFGGAALCRMIKLRQNTINVLC